jgi:phosphatidylglycerophosphate synthase
MANYITLARFPLLLVWVAMLYWGTPAIRLLGVAVLLLGLALDTVDGIVARSTGETSLLGSVLDIAADRAYELVLWVSFAVLGMIPVAVPVIVIMRTALTDALRSVGVAEGIAPFAQHRTALARFLVGSSWTRTGYSLAKVVAFCGLAVSQALDGWLLGPLQAVVWLTVALCLCRGVPVLAAAVPKRSTLP